MTPVNASGSVLRSLADDEVAFARHVYGDGTSSGGEMTGTVRFADGSPVPFAYVLAFDADGRMRSGAVTSSNGAYTIFELPTGDYWVVARPLTTDPYIMSSTPYRANPLRNLDFPPTSYGGSVASLVPVSEGSLTAEIHLVPSRAGSQPDLYEPNDARETASPLTLGVSRIATTHTSFDRDWYWFQTMASTCYVVATWFHGASTAPTVMEDDFWSRTWLTVYDGASVVAQNESRDEFQSDPRNWLTICEAGSGRRLDIEVAQRRTVGGAGYFYAVYVTPVAGGSARTPSIEWVYPTSGWSHRNRFVWIAGEDFMPGAKVEIRPPASGWVTASQVVTTGCDGTYRCIGIKALLPPGSSGTADLRVTNPNGRSVTKPAAFTYLANGPGPFDDRTVQAFGARFGQGKAVCIGDYNGDGSDDIFKTRNGSLPHQLFRSNGDGTFADVAASAGLQLSSSTFGQSCSFIDVDDDGDLDLYVTAVAYVLPNGASNALYLNQLSDGGGARFVLGTPPGLTGSPARYKSDAAWADFDRDGRVDVVLAYDSYAGSAPHDDALQYFRQGANGSFADITGSAGLAGYVASVTSLTSTDFNGDGCDDLLSLTYAGVANRLYRGDCRGHFTDMTAASHIADTAAWCSGSAVADFNSDGKPDILWDVQRGHRRRAATTLAEQRERLVHR
jgi:hypothetical protein